MQSVLAPLFKLLEASFELLIPMIDSDMVDKINSLDGKAAAQGEATRYVLFACLILVALGIVG
ncbi:MAG: hypothetical protein K2N47_02535, partial [Clostridia bacterium]|nr:hypothetical protein [Clostridia bacterium]